MVLQTPQQIPRLPSATIRRSYTAATLLLLIAAGAVIIFIVLIFTGFKLKGPIIRVDRINFNKLQAILAVNRTNVTITAVVSMRNPNYLASFKYGNTTTALLYHGAVVGEARGPPGTAIARRTARMHVTAEIMTDKILGRPEFEKDMLSGMVRIRSETRVGGRVEMAVVVKKHVLVEMNCTVEINVTSTWKVLHHKCKKKIKL